MKQAVGGIAVEIEICLQIFFSPAISEFKRFLWLYLGRKCKCTVKTGRESGQIKKDVKPQVGKKGQDFILNDIFFPQGRHPGVHKG